MSWAPAGPSACGLIQASSTRRLRHPALVNLRLTACVGAETEVVLLGEGSMARVLGPGRTIIHPCSLEGPACGLIPLQRPAVATSTGLRWNLGECTRSTLQVLADARSHVEQILCSTCS